MEDGWRWRDYYFVWRDEEGEGELNV